MVATTIGISSSSFIDRYERSMQRHPLQTKMATCFVGFGAGDFVAQTVNWVRHPPIDAPRRAPRKFLTDLQYARMGRMALFGGCIAAPQMHMFFSWLDKVRASLIPCKTACLHVKPAAMRQHGPFAFLPAALIVLSLHFERSLVHSPYISAACAAE